MPTLNDSKNTGRPGDWALAAALAIGAVLLLVWGPQSMTRWVAETLGWEQVLLPETTRVIEARDLAAPVVRTEGGRDLAQAITPSEVAATLERFASLPSRVAGYPGAAEAAGYIRERFAQTGLTGVQVDTFQVTVPVDRGGWLTLADSGE